MDTNNIKMIDFIKFPKNCSADRVNKSNKLVRFKSKEECILSEPLTDFSLNKQYCIEVNINNE